MIGQRLGPYEITAKLGEGGMGEVYRATDSKLRREVAIKVLPAAFVADSERLARFEREAQLLAQLHHPNIASIFGLEDSGGAHALVMELVEGPTLGERIGSGPIPLDEAVPIARQIAEALEAAHEKGIVHRDLKPQNIKLTPDGQVKVLDFGLAKAMDPAGSTAPSAADAARSPTLMNSPTLTAAGTQLGVILGTAAYMAPEQARGGAVDKRADIWAFGVVLYEMLSGRTLFAADTVPDTLARVLTREPDLEALPAAVPRPIRRLLRRCLERNPKNRLRDIGDARLALDEAPDDTAAPAPLPPPRSRIPAWRGLLPWAIAALALAAWAQSSWLRPAAREPAGPALTLPIDLGEESISLSFGAGAVLSPDGRTLAWVTGFETGGRNREAKLVVRELDGSERRVLAGTEGAQDPVFSPDGKELAYFASNALYTVAVGGGAPVRLTEVGQPRGVTWCDDGTLVYNRDVAEGLWRIPARGGSPQRLTSVGGASNERSHRWPRAIRGTRKALFLSQQLGAKYEEATIELLDLDSLQRTVVHHGGTYPRITRDHVMLYTRDRALWAAPLDVAKGALTSQPIRVLPEVGYSEWSGGAQFDVADNGALVYSTGRSDEIIELAWLDPASGKLEALPGDPGFFYTPDLARDGHSLALQVYSIGRSDIWIFDLLSGERRRLTFGGRDENPVWSPDGRWIAFSRLKEGGSRRLARILASGAGEPEPIAESDTQRTPSAWSPTGALAFTDVSPETHADVWVAFPDSPERAPVPFARTPANEEQAKFSPDGRWIVYESDESGAFEIYARSFPAGEGRWQISAHGGVRPVWAPDGSAVYYWSRQGLVRREILARGDALVPGATATVTISQPILDSDKSGYAIRRDGHVLLFPFAGKGQARTATVLVLGWDRELRSVLAAGR